MMKSFFETVLYFFDVFFYYLMYFWGLINAVSDLQVGWQTIIKEAECLFKKAKVMEDNIIANWLFQSFMLVSFFIPAFLDLYSFNAVMIVYKS